jgi:hypothetical protein
MGINRKAIASYLISLYCSTAILTEDAVGVRARPLRFISLQLRARRRRLRGRCWQLL